MRIQDQDERDFYEELAVRENWGKRELSRQYGSSLISFRAGYRIYLCSKAEKLKHQDLGQMQMYVNYFDRYEKTESENPTIGILLCPQKNDAMVELTSPKDSNIYASQYQLYLPDKKLLQKKTAGMDRRRDGRRIKLQLSKRENRQARHLTYDDRHY